MNAKRILIVEDRESSRELLRTVLRNLDLVVDEAGDGETAVRRAKAHIPDLILMDLRIPIRDGYAVLKELRGDGRFLSIPVIALTASAMLDDREKALAAGFDGYLSKPISLDHLRREVKRLLNTPENAGRKAAENGPRKRKHGGAGRGDVVWPM